MGIRWLGTGMLLLTAIAFAADAYAEERFPLQQLLETKNCQGCNLSHVNFQGIDLGGANLRGANLHQANLDGVDLSAAQLVDADLSHASLVQANLQGADLSRANLDATNLTHAVIDDHTRGLPRMPMDITANSPSRAHQPKPRAQLLVSLATTGQTYFAGKPVTLEQLSQQVSEFYQGEPEGVVILHAAQDATYNDVVSLLNQLRALGGDRVALATETVSPIFP